MSQEAKYLNDNINGFANYMSTSGIDSRFILIGTGLGLCVKPPLGGASCGKSNLPLFTSVTSYINSVNGNDVVVRDYSKWKDSVRPDATLNIVAVTDDKSSWTAQKFIDEIQKKGKADGIAQPTPELPEGFVYHSIVGYTPPKCNTMARPGTAYLELTARLIRNSG